ncbi:TraM recognition domain-containing protein [Streptomyces sp. NPDC008313]|uniref:TraM recognition domain-containing protein n=1 Tax=Streptomyces sp. NPDC008313 TaxID=3364826 RepID=UPI0036E96C1B
MRPDERDRRREGERGIPDGLLVGALAFLLGMTLLVWSAAGLAGLLAQGAWPDGVTFAHTPLAMRHLIGSPHDLPGAWPNTPDGQLSGYGLFWGLFIGQVMVLLVLTVFAMGTIARWRAVRARRRALGQATATGPDLSAPATDAGTADRPPTTTGTGTADRSPATGTATGTGPMEQAAAPTTASSSPAAARPEGAAAAVPPSAATVTATATAPVPAPADALGAGLPGPGGPGSGTAGWDGVGAATMAVPAPRGPVVLGTADTRRPVAIQAVRDAEGAALVITSDPAVWSETKDARAKLGPVLLYDPSHLCDTPARLHWSPVSGCEDKTTAAARAAALLAPVRPTARIDSAVADVAETLMRSYLHAAAVEGKAFRHVHRWAQGTQVQDAVRALRTNPKAASGAAGELEAALTSHPERRDVATQLTARALSALFTVNVRESCNPNRTDSLTLDSFVNEGGTLYVVGESLEDPRSNPGAMPLLTALASSVVERGRRMAERSSSGRLDPPLALVLDDVAAVAPLPGLPDLLSTGAGRGMPTLALLRSREQSRSRWPQYELPVQLPSPRPTGA